MKRAFIILGAVLCIAALPYCRMAFELMTASKEMPRDIKEGDVIFNTSPSNQSPLIQLATRSKISHCGVIVIKNCKPYVLETLGTLTLSPIKSFIARGKGGRYWLKRSELENMNIRYLHYLGKPYDKAFKFDNGIYYCSELVYDIYKKQFGVELCEPKKVGDYLLPGIDKLPSLRNEMKGRGITSKQLAVAPVDVFRSKKLKQVK